MKKIISLLMVLCLMASLCSMSAYADGTAERPEDLPKAIVKLTSAPDYIPLNYALSFKIDTGDMSYEDYGKSDQYKKYKDWYADFVLTCSADATFCAGDINKMVANWKAVTAEGADGYIAGHYEEFGDIWIPVPFQGKLQDGGFSYDFGGKQLNVNANQGVNVMTYLITGTGYGDAVIPFSMVYNKVKEFKCGVYFTDEFIKDNPGENVTVQLVLTSPDGKDSFVIGDTYYYTIPTPPPPPPVPATADNSNMPLWGILFIGFAAVAVLTAKKKKA